MDDILGNNAEIIDKEALDPKDAFDRETESRADQYRDEFLNRLEDDAIKYAKEQLFKLLVIKRDTNKRELTDTEVTILFHLREEVQP
jgi:hypothetical protein